MHRSIDINDLLLLTFTYRHHFCSTNMETSKRSPDLQQIRSRTARSLPSCPMSLSRRLSSTQLQEALGDCLGSAYLTYSPLISGCRWCWWWQNVPLRLKVENYDNTLCITKIVSPLVFFCFLYWLWSRYVK